jgi:hypothetical protein
MFVQVIQARVTDPGQVKAALDRWARDLAPDALGWLGTTAGVTDDGQFVALARFESEDAARRNSKRAEQDQWWSETARTVSGDASFHDSVRVDADMVGDPNSAGFVQVIQGETRDPDRVRELMYQDPEEWAAFRPDVLGSLSVEHAEGAYTTAIYFTSEAEAREGESKELPESIKSAMDEMNALGVGEPTFLDIKEPWLYSPR